MQSPLSCLLKTPQSATLVRSLKGKKSSTSLLEQAQLQTELKKWTMRAHWRCLMLLRQWRDRNQGWSWSLVSISGIQRRCLHIMWVVFPEISTWITDSAMSRQKRISWRPRGCGKGSRCTCIGSTRQIRISWNAMRSNGPSFVLEDLLTIQVRGKHLLEGREWTWFRWVRILSHASRFVDFFVAVERRRREGSCVACR